MDEEEEAMKRKCPECGGSYEREKITYEAEYKGRFYLFENVPAWVCSQCDASYLEAKWAKYIDRLVRGEVKPTRKVEVPVYDLAVMTGL